MNSGSWISNIIHTKIHTSQNSHIQNIDPQIMAKPVCTYKYQSTPTNVCVRVLGVRGVEKAKIILAHGQVIVHNVLVQ